MANVKCSCCPDPYLDLKDWYAIDNQMPPGPRSLYAQGDVVVPTGGYSVTLVEAPSPGINPTIRLLDLHVKRPSDPAPRVVETHTVRYDEVPHDGCYDEVHIRCGTDIVLKLDVQTAH